MAAKQYKSGDVVVSYDPDLCIHAAECVHGLPRVFDTQARPWIQPANATPEEIRAVIGKCPSGALEFRAMTTPAPTPPSTPSGVTVTVKPNGPYLVQGGAKVCDIAGVVLKEGAVLALCRCGQSAGKPFCDGTHGRVGWRS